MIPASEALQSRQRIREIAAKARADERTVKRVLRGDWKRNNAEERILEAMEALGVDKPAATDTPVRSGGDSPPMPRGQVTSAGTSRLATKPDPARRLRVIMPDGKEAAG